MNILLDTSVLVAAMVETHPAYESAFPYLQRMKDGNDTGFVAAHSLAETYSVLTRLPIQPRISPALAYEFIQTNVLESCTIVSLTADDGVCSERTQRTLGRLLM